MSNLIIYLCSAKTFSLRGASLILFVKAFFYVFSENTILRYLSCVMVVMAVTNSLKGVFATGNRCRFFLTLNVYKMQKPSTLKIESKDLILSKEYSLVKLRRENKELEAKISLMQKLTTTYKFYQYYFSNLPRFESSEKCFDYVNQLFF